MSEVTAVALSPAPLGSAKRLPSTIGIFERKLPQHRLPGRLLAHNDVGLIEVTCTSRRLIVEPRSWLNKVDINSRRSPRLWKSSLCLVLIPIRH